MLVDLRTWKPLKSVEIRFFCSPDTQHTNIFLANLPKIHAQNVRGGLQEGQHLLPRGETEAIWPKQNWEWRSSYDIYCNCCSRGYICLSICLSILTKSKNGSNSQTKNCIETPVTSYSSAPFENTLELDGYAATIAGSRDHSICDHSSSPMEPFQRKHRKVSERSFDSAARMDLKTTVYLKKTVTCMFWCRCCPKTRHDLIHLIHVAKWYFWIRHQKVPSLPPVLDP